MLKKLLAVFAHPDDESFGPGGTLAKYAAEGVEIHILCATRGEAGQWDEESISKIKNQKSKSGWEIHNVREEELRASAKILGLTKVEFLDFKDGTLCNNLYHKIANKITKKIKEFKPQVILTHDRLGVSGHLDHIAISMITTYSFLHTDIGNKLYYHCLSQSQSNREKIDNYFVYFPEGYPEERITTRIDYFPFWNKKVEAMYQHQSQLSDVKDILKAIKVLPKVDNLILQYHRGIKVNLPETNLFDGIGD